MPSAMVLDVGSWFRAQRATQSAADAAALAAAQGLPGDTGLASALGSGTAYVPSGNAAASSASVSAGSSRSDPATIQSAMARYGLDLVRPRLDDLARATGEAASLGVRDGDHVVVVLRAESTQPR